MRIVDLTMDNADDAISLCIGRKPGYELAREEKRRWLERLFPQSVGGKLAYSDGQLAGMLEYSPIEQAPLPVKGEELLHINCVWVLPRFQRRGIGQSLVRSCLAEAKTRGRRGLSVMTYSRMFFMPSTFFLNQGFRSVGTNGELELMWKEIEPPCKPPTFLPAERSAKEIPGKLVVEVFCSAQCPWSIMTRERIKRVSREFGKKVKVELVNVNDRESLEKYGDSRKVFLNGNESYLTYPTEEDIRKILEIGVKDLAKRH